MINYAITFDYKFSSGLGSYYHSRFIKDVNITINLTDDNEVVLEQIGEAKFLIFHAGNVFNSEYELFDVLESHSRYISGLIFDIYDSDEDGFTEIINDAYFDINNYNLCLIDKITISPKYRGFQIGNKLIKDIIFNHSEACGLFAIHPFPLQFEAEADSEEYKRLELGNFEKNKEKATKKLHNYFKSIGFDAIPEIEYLLFYNPVYENKRFDTIDLDDDKILDENLLNELRKIYPPEY